MSLTGSHPPRRLAVVALLLTLLLHLGGGVLAAGHLHPEEGVALDHSCLVCALASVVAAPGAAALLLATLVTPCAAALGNRLEKPLWPRVPLPPARAPPLHS